MRANLECARGKGGKRIGICGDNATIWPKVQELVPETKVFKWEDKKEIHREVNGGGAETEISW